MRLDLSSTTEVFVDLIVLKASFLMHLLKHRLDRPVSKAEVEFT